MLVCFRPLRDCFSSDGGQRLRRALVAMAIGSTLLAAHAQIDPVSWWTVDGGGATSTGNIYSITGTIGQPDAGVLSGGNFTLEGGFWCSAWLEPETEAPSIWYARLPAAVRLSWAPSASGSVLEHARRLTAPIPWDKLDQPYFTNANEIYVVVPISGQSQFYRLRKP